jgi:adenosylcobinamide kinase/adenosylcobinamide-phosphate guanylyltransferase
VAEVFRKIKEHDVVVLDCLTLWLTNLLVGGNEQPEVLRRVEELAEVLGERKVNAVIVTNEVGLGLVPESALGRDFRDVAGRAHQRLAATADEVYLGVMGLMLKLKPGGVVSVPLPAYSRGG